jgi:uncharacterized protein
MKTTSTLIAALALGVAACTGSAAPASAQSFNCNYAKTADEVLICQSPELARMDTVVSESYFSLRNSLDSRSAAWLKNQQAEWLQARMSCGRDYSCIYYTYARRWSQIMFLIDVQCHMRGWNCEDLGAGGDGSIKMSGPL